MRVRINRSYLCARHCVLVMVLAGPGLALAVDFQSVQILQSGIGNTTVLALGPEDPDPGAIGDGCVYAANRTTGQVRRICFDSVKSVTSNTVVVDLNGGSSVDGIQGMAIDPDSDPAGEIHLYLAYADDDDAPYQGKIARAVSTDGGTGFVVDEDFVTDCRGRAFRSSTTRPTVWTSGCFPQSAASCR